MKKDKTPREGDQPKEPDFQTMDGTGPPPPPPPPPPGEGGEDQ